MTIIVCVDDRMGQAFHDRRLSRDRVLCGRVLELAAGRTLRMAPYSLPLFEGVPASVSLAAEEDYLDRAGPEDLCFVEREDLSHRLDRADRLLLYRWNRTYPSDLSFPAQALEERWTLTASAEFSGSSHEKITEEIYERS